ncbi:MAG TPA: NAD(P)H-hydrate dehydratase [Acidobacteriota bacterium]|nr:NAD(P)H-hydrate dehydratase [Acidobacteriota bacterium]
MQILTAQQMGKADRLCSERYGIPSLTLMENAGFNLYLALRDVFEELSGRRAAIICGPGNNGGDGLVLARQLLQRDISTRVFLLASPQKLKGDAETNYKILKSGGVEVIEVPDLETWMEWSQELRHFDIVTDAILGTGINRPVQPDSFFGAVISDINACGAFVLAVDIPSGMRSDRLAGGDLTVQADVTVTFAAPKLAHILNHDLEAVGDLMIAPIGTPAELLDEVNDPPTHMMTPQMISSCLPPRPVAGHKGDFGRLAVVAGSLGKAGAAGLSSRSALRAGAGLVTAFVPEAVQAQVASMTLEVMTEGLPSSDGGAFQESNLDDLLQRISDNDAVALGPGLGDRPETFGLVRALVEQAELPMVIDADGLNAFAECPQRLKGNPQRPLILTPHPGEFARLLGCSLEEVVEDRLELSRRFAQEHQLWLVMKSFRTLLATPQGEVFVCPLGNPGMATAGMGDVLTGVLGACAAMRSRHDPQGLTQAALAGVFLHSQAGDQAQETVGQDALMAGDVIDHLGKAYGYLRSLQ